MWSKSCLTAKLRTRRMAVSWRLVGLDLGFDAPAWRAWQHVGLVCDSTYDARFGIYLIIMPPFKDEHVLVSELHRGYIH